MARGLFWAVGVLTATTDSALKRWQTVIMRRGSNAFAVKSSDSAGFEGVQIPPSPLKYPLEIGGIFVSVDGWLFNADGKFEIMEVMNTFEIPDEAVRAAVLAMWNQRQMQRAADGSPLPVGGMKPYILTRYTAQARAALEAAAPFMLAGNQKDRGPLGG